MIIRILALLFSLLSVATAAVAAVSIAVFPLQDLGEGRNDVNLAMTRDLEIYLAENGNNIVGVDTVIKFMANNRIRTAGQLQSYNAFRVRDELRAGFVLLGTVIQRKEWPDPTLALYLSLTRTNDARTIWSYSGSVSAAEQRNALGVNEPQSSAELQTLLFDEMLEHWPWQRINEVQELEAVSIDSIHLAPSQVRPGEEIHCNVRVRESWGASWAPRVFFKVDEQIYPATVSEDGKTFVGTWVAGDQSSRAAVHLLLDWTQYGRTETVLLGSYLVDGSPPFLELDLRGGIVYDGKPVFSKRVTIVPKLLVRQPLARWRLHINYLIPEMNEVMFIGEMKGEGSIPGNFVWNGNAFYGDGSYDFIIEAWDRAGNYARANKVAEYTQELPAVVLALAKGSDEMVLDVDYAGKVPLRYWRLEMWSKEGRLLTKAEGNELPVKVGFTPPAAGSNQEISGFVYLQDAFGKQARVKVEELLPELNNTERKGTEASGVSENWVDEF